MVRQSNVESKGSIRVWLRSLREALPPSEIVLKSRLIEDRLLGLSIIADCAVFGLYASVGSEVRTEGIFRILRERQKRVAYPRTQRDGMQFIEVSDLSGLQIGRWGIPEPQGNGSLLSLDRMDVVVIPGIGFDEEGYRIGYGKGFYDRALKGFQGIKIGLSYEQQIVKSIPLSADEIRCDWICTEKRLIRCQ